MKEFAKKHENILLSILATLSMVLFVGAFFDYFYQANDDFTIKNILSGVYTGTPEIRNIQMHFPISLFLSSLYAIARGLPWYGLYLCACHYFAAFWMFLSSAKYLTRKTENRTFAKVLVVLAELTTFTGVLLYELTFVQYTVSCALLVCAGMLGLFLSDETLPPKEFLLSNVPNVLLIGLAFITRSEMCLLMLPFVCVAGFIKWMSTKQAFTKENLIRFLGAFGLMLALIGLCQGVHVLAYQGSEWKEFQQFFDDRTTLYDYQFVPDKEEFASFYESIGLGKAEAELLHNYNFGIDEDITSQTLAQTAAYASSLKTQTSLIGRMKEALPDYKYILRYGQEGDRYGSNYREMVIVLAVLLVLLAYIRKNMGVLWKLLLLFFVRSGLWVYMISTGRYPVRITHSLYFIEIVLLFALLLEQTNLRNKREKFAGGFVAFFIAFFGIAILMPNMQGVREESERRVLANTEMQSLTQYAKTHNDKFFFVDVYSLCSYSVDGTEYSEKCFEDVDNSYANYDLLGGWLMNSPYTDKKLDTFGVQKLENRIENAILRDENVYVVTRDDRDTQWLTDYYLEKRELTVNIEKEDRVGNFTIWNVNPD